MLPINDSTVRNLQQEVLLLAWCWLEWGLLLRSLKLSVKFVQSGDCGMLGGSSRRLKGLSIFHLKPELALFSFGANKSLDECIKPNSNTLPAIKAWKLLIISNLDESREMFTKWFRFHFQNGGQRWKGNRGSNFSRSISLSFHFKSDEISSDYLWFSELECADWETARWEDFCRGALVCLESTFDLWRSSDTLSSVLVIFGIFKSTSKIKMLTI